MWCPHCAFAETKVIDSRLNQTGDSTRRRRACPKCEARFTTYERVEESVPWIVKKDGRREAFLRDKLKSGLEKACQKRPVTREQIETVISSIEKGLAQTGVKEIPSHHLGRIVMKELHALDAVAYVRFASVYRNFQDVEEFVAEITDPSALSQNIDPTPDRPNTEDAPDSSSPDQVGYVKPE